MEIKSSLLNSEDFKYVKQSIIDISARDNQEKFRVDLIEYINDSSYDENDQFFYESLEDVRFLDPKGEYKDSVAFTDPYKIIYLNAPKPSVVKNMKQWDFVYDHECLHQLWETFAVEDRIKEKDGDCDHFLLNIASDCVINEYLTKNRKKESPTGLISADYLKTEYGVEYNHKEDTQYSLYFKLKTAINENKSLQNKMKNDSVIQNSVDKIDPKEVRQSSTPPSPPLPPVDKPSDEYKKGWSDGIKDVLSKKVDPLTYTPKSPKGDYDKGYNDVIKTIKKGLTDGIDLGGSSGGADDSGLEQIPWNLPPQNSNSSGSNSSNDKNNQNNKGQNSQDSKDNKDQNTDNQTPSADAKSSADAAKDASNNAAKNAENAKKAAKSAEQKKAAEKAEKAAKEAEAAAKEAEAAAKAAADAEAKGDAKAAKEAAERAEEAFKKADNAANKAAEANEEAGGDPVDSSSDSKSDSNSKNSKPGTESGDDIRIKEKIKLKREKLIKGYTQQISGELGVFLNKCKSSVKCEKSGLAVNTHKGVASWDDKLTMRVNSYVKNRIFQKKRLFKKTYRKVKRGSGFIEYGEPIMPGKRIRDDKLTINVAFYIDRSGSMSGNPINNVFKTAYSIANDLKKKFGREEVVDKVSFKMCAFDYNMHELKWGETMGASGGTMDLQDIFKYIEDKSKNYLINIIITDGQFNVNKSEVNNFLKKLDGLFIFVTNTAQAEVESISKENSKNASYILADSNFDINKK